MTATTDWQNNEFFSLLYTEFVVVIDSERKKR